MRTWWATPEDESIAVNHGRLDAYGLTHVNTFGLISTFSYIVQKMDVITSDNIIVIENVPVGRTASGDQTPEQGQAGKPEVLPHRLSRYELQITCWVKFLQWMGNIAVEALRDQATAAMFAAEAAQHDQLTLITSAQTKDWPDTYEHTFKTKGYDK